MPLTRTSSHRPAASLGPGPDLRLARLLLLTVYEETTPQAAELRHCALELVDTCRSRARRGGARKAREQLARLGTEIERARRCGCLDARSAHRLADYVAQVDRPRRCSEPA